VTAQREENQSETDLLSPERATLGQSGLAARRLAENGRAALADDDGLGVGEDGGDGEAAGALDVHEEGSRSGNKRLELVLAGLGSRRGVEEINRENHLDLSGRSRVVELFCENGDD
jgi:hypothetical protein